MLIKKLGDYKAAELSAVAPSLILIPYVPNDSRRLIVSNFPLRFLCTNNNENIDFQSSFSANDPNEINYATLLRTNSSFPYVLPSVSLPTEAQIEVFDSGLKDNFGMKITLNYINQLKEWFLENTSQLIILQIKDGLSTRNKPKNKSQSIVSELMSLFGGLYDNWFEI